MRNSPSSFLSNYQGIILLLTGIAIGSVFGLFMPERVSYLKPVGDLFLNLLFTAVIPLVFFAISSAVATIQEGRQLGRILRAMSGVFLITVLLAAISTIVVLYFFPLDVSSVREGATAEEFRSGDELNWGDRFVSFFSVGEFNQLLSREHMLAFILFSFLIGFSALKTGEKADVFTRFLVSGNEVMKSLLVLIMKAAPLGLGAYFAVQVGSVGPELFGIYAKPLGVYYVYGFIYFIVFFSLYACWANGIAGVKSFWRHNITPTLTAVSTCSSMAVIPANLEAARKIGVSDSVSSVVIPLGASLHKDGSSISSVIKIAVAFALIGRDFFEPQTLLVAVGITVLVSIVAGGIPNGGYIGEMLMVSAYGLPIEAVPAVMIIGTLVDPMATVLNATGDTVAAMLTDRFVKNKP